MTACATHPDAEAVGTCHRCGRFFCADEAVLLDAQQYCAECGARDDVDWLGAWAKRLHGKRSGLVWFLSACAVLLALAGLALLIPPESSWRQRAIGAALLSEAAAAALFFVRHRRARVALVAAGVLLAITLLTASDHGVAAVGAMPFLALAAAAWTDVPTQLWLGEPVSRGALRRHFDREGSNPLAITASRLAFASLIIPGLGLVSLCLGVLAWTRVDPMAKPPVGNRLAAIVAVFFSLFTSAIWAATIFRL